MSAAPRVALISGGSSGIGLAAAEALFDAGYRIVLAARGKEQLERCRVSLARRGGDVDHVVMDALDRAQVAAAVGTVLDRHQRIDVLVNSAGVNVARRQWHDLDAAEFDHVVAGNLTTCFNLVHAVLPQMRAQRDGTIINVASGAGKVVTVGGGVAYTVAKHGVVALTQSINMAEFRNGVRACAISPGETATPIMAKRDPPPPQDVLDRMLQPADVGRAIRFIVEMPAHAAVYELVLSPTWNRAWL